jgi:hypothetical protein
MFIVLFTTACIFMLRELNYECLCTLRDFFFLAITGYSRVTRVELCRVYRRSSRIS